MLLLAYDASPSAQRALEHAAKLAGQGGDVAVINVIPAPQAVSSRLETLSEADFDQQDTVLREAEALLALRGIEPQLLEAVGDPATEILAAAERTNAKTIVLGRSTTRRLGHAPLDSRLVRSAEADVLVVP
jgi:nucleotide-binding universal stress UspA family protein